ncbi:MAG: polymer-forming cytoskeletal protein [Acidobacteria bacterium]|nr:polymer-forming cytoskeletal protein [Acidobacteriota bacterium]
MGRNSKTESGSSYGESPSVEPEAPYRYQTEPQPAGMRGGAISDSDAMARDIKEGRLSGFVGHGTTLTGETEFQAMLRVDGHLIGTVSSDSGTLIVGTNGVVDANVSVAAAMINGVVNGDVIASEKLQLGRTAQVIGNIQSPRLVVEEGAVIEGKCSMMRAREDSEKSVAEKETVEYQASSAYTETAQTEEERLAAALFDETPDEEEAAEAAGI